MKRLSLISVLLAVILAAGCEKASINSNDGPDGPTDVPLVTDPGTVLGTVSFVQQDTLGNILFGPAGDFPLGTNNRLDLDKAAILTGVEFPNHMITISATYINEDTPLSLMFVDTANSVNPTCILYYRVWRDSAAMFLPAPGGAFTGRIVAFYLDIAPPPVTDPVTLTISGQGHSDSVTIDPVENCLSTANLLTVKRENLPADLPDELMSRLEMAPPPGQESHGQGFISSSTLGGRYGTAASSGAVTMYTAVDPDSWTWELRFFVFNF